MTLVRRTGAFGGTRSVVMFKMLIYIIELKSILLKRMALFQYLVLSVSILTVYAEECPPKNCTEEISPVCGTDLVTYTNECHYDNANCGRSLFERIYILHPGPCVKKDACPRVCPAVLEPVCGSDGRTYSNECRLIVFACRNPEKDVRFAHDSACNSDLG